MTTTLARPAEPATRRRALLTTTRVLVALFGALKLTSTTYFLFFASAEAGGDPQGLGDWTVGVWSIALGAAYLVVAARLGRHVLPLAAGVAVADVAFSIVKLTVYDEFAGVVFMGITLVMLALVAASERPRQS
jgi:hypothetical protein